jgi:hypothetical protein
MKEGKRLTMGDGMARGIGKCIGCGRHDLVKEFDGDLLCPVCEAEYVRFYGVVNIVIIYLEDLIRRGIATERDIRSVHAFLPEHLVG